MKEVSKILSLFFSPEDDVSVGNGPYSTHSIAQASVLSGEVTLLSPNPSVPVQKVKTNQLTHLCINACKGFRSDSAITKYRAFLLELDIGTIKGQFQYVQNLELPYSCMVFSGSKSLHTAIVLEEPVENEKLYRKLYQWILNIGTAFDQNCKNPSRCIRMPGSIRPETGKEQKLLQLKERVSINTLMEWLESHPDEEPKEPVKRNLTGNSDYSRLSLWAKIQLKEGIDFSMGRNKAWFSLACDFAKNGYTEEEATEILEGYFFEESDFKKKEFLTSVSSAYKHMGSK